MSYTQIQMTVNPTIKSWIASPTNQSLLAGVALPTLNYGDIAVLCLSFVDNNGDVYPLEAGDEFTLAIDSSPRNVTDTADLMAYSDNDEVDIAGDWSDISRPNGKISIRITAQRDLFSSRITEADGSQECWLSVHLTPSGESNHCAMVQDLANCDGTVIAWAASLWTPALLTTASWFDAFDSGTVRNTTGAVYQWDDKSGNGFHLLQAAGGSQPTTDAVTIGTKNAVQFDGGDYMNNTANVVSQPASFAIIFDCDPKPAAGFEVIADSAVSDRMAFYVDTTKYNLYAGSGFGSSPCSSDPDMVTAVYNGASSSLGINGDLTPSTGNAGAGGLSGGFQLGAEVGVARYFNGKIGEVVIASGIWSTDTRQKVEGYLAWKWGQSAKLPATHPYKDAPPYA